jgi:hypothetical protein
MALSMDEQRVLAEIERRLTAEDPGLAACMTNFRRPGPAAVLRSPRGRIIGSLFTVLLVAMISLMVYAMIPFRGHATRTPAGHTGVPTSNQISATGASTGAGSGATLSASGSGKAATSTATSTAASGSTGTRTAATGKATEAGTTAHSAKPQTTSPSHPTQTRANTAGS